MHVSQAPTRPNQIDAIIRWNEARPGPGFGERYVRLYDGVRGTQTGSNGADSVTVEMDGDDIGFQVSETRKLAKPFPSLELATRTSISGGAADARSTIGAAGRAVLDALAGSETLRHPGPSGTFSMVSDFYVTMTERDADGNQVRTATHGYRDDQLPADLARAFDAARTFADQFDGEQASLVLQDGANHRVQVK